MVFWGKNTLDIALGKIVKKQESTPCRKTSDKHDKWKKVGCTQFRLNKIQEASEPVRFSFGKGKERTAFLIPPAPQPVSRAVMSIVWIWSPKA